MSAKAELVAQFRTVVDTILENHTAARRGRVGRRSDVLIGNRYYVSAGPRDSRILPVRDVGEHCWAIVQRGMRTANYRGFLAIAAYAGQDESLSRLWAIDAPFGTPIETEKPIDEEEPMAMALDWARSPDLFAGHAAILGALDTEEAAAVANRYARSADSAARIKQAMERNAQSRISLDFRPH